MPKNQPTAIKTYSVESFRESYMQPAPKTDALLKTAFGTFFIVRVEEMIRLIKLPVPPARSTNHTIIYLTDGEAIMTIGSETYKIFRNECLVVPAGQVFSFANVDLNQGYLCNFHNDVVIEKFGKADLLNGFEFLRVWGNPRIQVDGQTAEFVRQLFNRQLINYSTNGLTQPDIIQSYLIALLCELNGMYKPLAGDQQTSATVITNRFKELIFANIKTHHLVADYAAMLHITPNHLNKTVKAITGKSPTRWIDEAIILEAKVLLYQTSLSISEVTAEVGLVDSSYFSRFFRKYAGVTPALFRKMIEKS